VTVLVAMALAAAPGVAGVQDDAGRNDDREDPARTPDVIEATPLPELSSLGVDLSGGSDYTIGRQDLLEISVFDLPELDHTVRVADDGSITLPLLGRMIVAGLTKHTLEELIEEMLAERYVRDPQVTIFVREYESKKIAVTGAVRNPGTYEMLGRRTLLEMISIAGGLDKDLGKHIYILRRGADGVAKPIEVDLERLVYAADPTLNHTIAAGDIIYVPTVKKIRIFVSGAVRDPNQYEVPEDQPVTVLRAITLAGGTTDRAGEKRVQIVRTSPEGERTIIEVNLRRIKKGKAEDPRLLKDDLVLVPESFF
jgi:polysaccharide export outer membrane protein